MAVDCYTQYMGGVDRADQGMWYMLNIHMTLKWWKKVLVYLLEVSFVNSWTVWKALHPGKCLKQEKFPCAIVYGLVDGYAQELMLALDGDQQTSQKGSQNAIFQTPPIKQHLLGAIPDQVVLCVRTTK